MHPHTFYTSLFDAEKRDEVFVITSFTEAFEPRWRDVIEPCIRDDLKLTPVRVDYRTSGDSIITDILDGIARARLIVADITSTPISYRDRPDAAETPRRSANVMWELGIAHVMRLPDEVLIMRSDNDANLFDLTQFRVFDYDPREATEARRVLASRARDRLASIKTSGLDLARRVAGALDVESLGILYEAAGPGTMPHFPELDPDNLDDADELERPRVMPHARARAVQRLLELGAIRLQLSAVTKELVASGFAFEDLARYQLTALGRAVVTHCHSTFGFNDPAIESLMTAQRLSDDD